MKKFGYICEVVGILGVSIFMLLASLALSLSRLMASISLALLFLVPRGILNPVLSSKYSPLTVVQKGDKVWITMKILSLTFGLGFERKNNGEIVTHATDKFEAYDNAA